MVRTFFIATTFMYQQCKSSEKQARSTNAVFANSHRNGLKESRRTQADNIGGMFCKNIDSNGVPLHL